MPVTKCPNCGFRMLSKCPNCGYAMTQPLNTGGAPQTMASSGSSSTPSTFGEQSSIMPSFSPGSVVPITSSGTSATPLSALGALPPYMPTYPPELEGHVAIPPNSFRGVYTPVHWAVKFNHPGLRRRGGHPKPNWETNITSVRVRRQDGAEREARLEGNIVGGSISLGDPVSIWGKDVSGTLIVQRAYNHSTGAEIRLRPPYNLVMEQIRAYIIIGLIILCVFGGLISALANAGH